MKPTNMVRYATIFSLGIVAFGAKDHPVGKVIDMLKGLEEKSATEAKTEAVAYQKFAYWCKSSTSELDKAIAEEKTTIEDLSSKIDGQTKAKAGLIEQIAKLTKEIEKATVAGVKATNERDDGAKLYGEADEDFASTIGAIELATKALTDSEGETDSDFLQEKVQQVLALTSAYATEIQKKTLQSFIQTVPADVMAKGDQSAHEKKYSFKSGSVIELLKTLQGKFEDERLEATKAETNAINAYDESKQARDTAIAAAGESKKEKQNVLAEVEKALNDAQKDRKDTTQDLTADSLALKETYKDCTVKKTEWEERSKVRAGETQAMEAAIKILAKVGGVRTDAPGNPVPPTNPVSFLQIDDPKMKVVTFLREQAHLTKAKALQRLAQQISAHLTGPFDEVNGMIEQMIFRLMAEQKDEDDHKNWCDLEREKTDKMIDDKEDKIKDLTSKMDDATAAIAELTEEISEDDDMILKIEMFSKQATEIRKTGKKENVLAIKDAQDAQTAVASAVAVLTDFYKESGEIAKEPHEFLQEDTPVELGSKPATWDSSYTGVSDPDNQPSGIITVMLTCAEDFAEMEADTKAQEATDEKTFQDAMQANAIEKSRRMKEGEVKGNEKKRRVDELSDLTKRRKQVSDELEATDRYRNDLKPACDAGDSSYEDRKAARAKEIEALQMAQVILRDAFKEPSGKFLQVRQHRR